MVASYHGAKKKKKKKEKKNAEKLKKECVRTLIYLSYAAVIVQSQPSTLIHLSRVAKDMLVRDTL